MDNSLNMDNYDMVDEFQSIYLAQQNCQEIDFNNSIIWQNGC